LAYRTATKGADGTVQEVPGARLGAGSACRRRVLAKKAETPSHGSRTPLANKTDRQPPKILSSLKKV
jgi:hypothetical protein